jgi:hypothetical protein
MDYIVRELRQERDLFKKKVWNWRDVGQPFPSKPEAMRAMGAMPQDYPRIKGRVIVERSGTESREVASDYYGYGGF